MIRKIMKTTQQQSNRQTMYEKQLSENLLNVPCQAIQNGTHSSYLTSTEQAALASQLRKESRANRIRRNILKTLAIVSLCFIICLSPNQIYFFLINIGVDLKFDTPFFDFSVFIMVCNVICNPFVYTAQYVDYRRQLWKVFGKQYPVGKDMSEESSSNVQSKNHSSKISMIPHNQSTSV